MRRLKPLIVRSRDQALNEGMIWFFTGQPCKNGHISERYTKSSLCIARVRAAAAKRYQVLTVEMRQVKYLCARARDKEMRERHDSRIAALVEYQGAQKERRDLLAKATANESRDSPSLKYQSHFNKQTRRTREALATPPWADMDKINALYREANRLGLHVDHVIPLRGKTVCGLHTHENLQLLDPENNLKKSARFSGHDYEWSLEMEIKRMAAFPAWQKTFMEMAQRIKDLAALIEPPK